MPQRSAAPLIHRVRACVRACALYAQQLVLSNQNAAFYDARPVAVHAVRVRHRTVIHMPPPVHSATARPGDWLVMGPRETDVDVCPAAHFDSRFAPLPLAPHCYLRRGRVLARQLRSEMAVDGGVDGAAESVLRMAAGKRDDWLVQDAEGA